MTQNGRALNFGKVLEEHPVATADTGDRHLQQACIRFGIGRLKVLNLYGAVGHGHGGFECVSHVGSFDWPN